MNKSKPEQGQGEKFIAMVNPVVWSKGARGGDCNGNNLCTVATHDLSCVLQELL